MEPLRRQKSIIRRRSTLSSIDILEISRKMEEQRRISEIKKMNEMSLKMYFKKEEGRRRELIERISNVDVAGGGKRKYTNKCTNHHQDMKTKNDTHRPFSNGSRNQNRKNNRSIDLNNKNDNKSFYCVHMLMKYQEVMLSGSYIAPSIRGQYYINGTFKETPTLPPIDFV